MHLNYSKSDKYLQDFNFKLLILKIWFNNIYVIFFFSFNCLNDKNIKFIKITIVYKIEKQLSFVVFRYSFSFLVLKCNQNPVPALCRTGMGNVKKKYVFGIQFYYNFFFIQKRHQFIWIFFLFLTCGEFHRNVASHAHVWGLLFVLCNLFATKKYLLSICGKIGARNSMEYTSGSSITKIKQTCRCNIIKII